MPTALITGASKGIGFATALELDRRGWQVFAGYRDPAGADRLRAEASERLTVVPLDVTSDDDRARAATLVGERLDALINNAGIVVAGPLEFVPVAALREQFEVNVIGAIALTQAVLPALRAAHGRIVNVSSINGHVVSPFSTPYAASKFALEAVSDGWRMELRRWNIATILIEPGAIATPIWDASRERAQRISGAYPDRATALYGGMIAALGRVTTPARARPPEAVARVIARALAARRPRPRYLIGRDARMAMWLKRLLPTRWFDALLAGRRRA